MLGHAIIIQQLQLNGDFYLLIAVCSFMIDKGLFIYTVNQKKTEK